MRQKSFPVITVFTALALLLAAFQSSSAREDGRPDIQPRVFKVAFPKLGFAGSPMSHIMARTPLPIRGPQDFETHFARVSVLDYREIEGGKRTVLRIDEVDQEGNLQREGLYYAYLDQMPKGARIVSRYRDDGGCWDEVTGVRNIPFPFSCARPPALGSHKKTHDGHLHFGRGTVYEEIPSVLWVRATRFELEGHADSETVQWYGSDIDGAVNDPKAKILSVEKQKWLTADDWLWDEMERVDARGNVLLKCSRVK